MIRILQKTTVFYASKFEAAAKAIKESGKEPWIEKVSKSERNQLWALFKQATEGDVKQTMKQDMRPPQENVTQSASQKSKEASNKSSMEHDKQQFDAWNKYKGKSKEEAENQYVKLAKDLLMKHKAEKFIKDF